MGATMVNSTPNVWCDNCGQTVARITVHPDGSVINEITAVRVLLKEEGWLIAPHADYDLCLSCRTVGLIGGLDSCRG